MGCSRCYNGFRKISNESGSMVFFGCGACCFVHCGALFFGAIILSTAAVPYYDVPSRLPVGPLYPNSILSGGLAGGFMPENVTVTLSRNDIRVRIEPDEIRLQTTTRNYTSVFSIPDSACKQIVGGNCGNTTATLSRSRTVSLYYQELGRSDMKENIQLYNPITVTNVSRISDTLIAITGANFIDVTHVLFTSEDGLDSVRVRKVNQTGNVVVASIDQPFAFTGMVSVRVSVDGGHHYFGGSHKLMVYSTKDRNATIASGQTSSTLFSCPIAVSKHGGTAVQMHLSSAVASHTTKTPSCEFAGMVVNGTYVNDQQISCETPWFSTSGTITARARPDPSSSWITFPSMTVFVPPNVTNASPNFGISGSTKVKLTLSNQVSVPTSPSQCGNVAPTCKMYARDSIYFASATKNSDGTYTCDGFKATGDNSDASRIINFNLTLSLNGPDFPKASNPRVETGCAAGTWGDQGLTKGCHACDDPAVCLGGNRCAGTRTGVRCAGCDESSFMFQGNCVACGAGQPILFGFFILFLVLLGYKFSAIALGDHENQLGSAYAVLIWAQTLGAISTSVKIPWPQVVLDLSVPFQFALFDFSAMNPFCGIRYSIGWLVALGSTLPYMMVIFCVLFHLVKTSIMDCIKPKGEVEDLGAEFSKMVPFTFAVLDVLMMVSVQQSLIPFGFIELEPEVAMISKYPSVRIGWYGRGDWGFMLFPAIASFVTWGMGFVAYVIGLVYGLGNDEGIDQSLLVFTSRYQHDGSGINYMVLLHMRKVAIAFFCVILGPEFPMAASIVLLIILACTLPVYIVFRPYRCDTEGCDCKGERSCNKWSIADWTEVLSLSSTMIYLIFGIAVTAINDSNSPDTVGLGWALGIIMIVTLILLFVLINREIKRRGGTIIGGKGTIKTWVTDIMGVTKDGDSAEEFGHEIQEIEGKKKEKGKK